MLNYSGKSIVASVQAEPVWFDADATVAKSIALIEEAAHSGAELIAFPEVFISGYPWQLWLGTMGWATSNFATRFHSSAVTLDSEPINRLREAARKNSITVVMGYTERDAGSHYMSQVFIGDDGQILGNRRKLKPTHVERVLYGEGDGSDLRTFDLSIARIGGLNCWEHYQPLTKYAMYSLHEQLHIASWPSMSMSGYYIHTNKASEEISRAYAMEGQTFVAVSTQIVTQSAHDFFCETPEQSEMLGLGGGFTRIFGPDGSDLAEALAADAEGIIFAEIDLEAIAIAKTFADPVGHYSRPDALSLRWRPTHNRRVEHDVDQESPQAPVHNHFHAETLSTCTPTAVSKSDNHLNAAPDQLIED